MASTRGTSLIAGLAAVAALLAAPAAASAVVYCVPDDTIDPSCDAGQDQATIQGALSAAQGSNAVADTVRIDAGNYSETGLVYSSVVATNVLTVIGDGTAQTVLTIPNTTGVTNGIVIGAPAGSSISGVAMTIPTNMDTQVDSGFFLGGGTLGQGLLVTGPNATVATGVHLTGNASLDNSTVNLPFAASSNRAVFDEGNNAVTDSTLHADTGVYHSGAAFTSMIDRMTVQAPFRGVTIDSGTVNVRNTIIDLGAGSGIGLDANNSNPSTLPKTINADHVTIAGGIAGSIGFRVQATAATAAQTSTGTLDNSVISGPQTPISRQASNDGSPMTDSQANVTTSYSNYNGTANVDSNGNNGTGSITETNPTNFPPGFVGGGDFHLVAGSALIDIGDPAAATGADIDGDPRGVSGTCPVASGRRDIGADEFVPTCVTPPGVDTTPPETTIGSHPRKKTFKRRGTFTFSSSEPGATFLCSYDSKPYVPCAGSFTTPKLRKGRHRFDVLSADQAGNRDASAATFLWKVLKRRSR